MSEHDVQCAVVKYCDAMGYPCYAVPNGQKRTPAQAAWLRDEGMRPGVPDLCLPVARGRYHSLYIEMKYGTNKATDEQAAWIRALREQGMCAYVCYGASSAIALIDLYMALEAPPCDTPATIGGS